MKEIEELFASASPKFLLDHYLNVLNVISWKFIESKEGFTSSDLVGKLLEDARSLQDENPFYARMCSRSTAVVEEVVNELVSLGLLIKDGKTFRKTDDFSEFYYMLKNRVRKSLRRYVAWAIWYTYRQKNLTSFSMSELLTLLSYQDEDYIDEIPYLVKWREDGWFGFLEKSGNEWKLLEKPYTPSRSMLLTDIDGRLSNAIFELSKTRDKFHAEEIVGKLRELERTNAERALKRFGLKFENERWQLNVGALSNVKELLKKEEIERWPFLGTLISRNPYFRLQSRTMYVDIPNTTIWSFLGELERISYEHKDDKEELYEKAKELANAFNKSLRQYLGKWAFFAIRKQPFGSKPFGVQVKVNWQEFHSFLDGFAESELPLGEKYSHILNCRAPSIALVLRGDLERVQHDVKEICREEMEQIGESLEDLVNRINEAKDYLFKITSHRKTIPIEPSTLEYFPEMMSTLRALISLVENGTIPACYREMRKVLENLSWMIFDDMLLYKTSVIRKGKHTEEPLMPYRFVSKEWYDWAYREKRTIRNLRELEKKIKDLSEDIYVHGKSQGYNWNKKQIEKTLFRRISYPLLLLLTGINVQVPKKLEKLIPQCDVEMLRILATEDMKNVLQDLGCKHLSKLDCALTEEIVNTSIGKALTVVPPYPSNEFVLGFISKRLSSRLLEPYKEYSQFVHSYFTSWHIFPFSSVLEFKVFRHELSIFTRTVMQLINSYLEELFR